MYRQLAIVAATTLCLSGAAQASVYPGNGASGFGGAVGGGSLEFTDTINSMTVTGYRGPGQWNDVLSIYLDTKPGGVNDTSTFTDTGDGGRKALSGTDGTNRTTVTFPTGFGADYGINIENGYIACFDLSNPANFTFLFGGPQSGNNTAASYSLTLTDIEMLLLNITAGTGQSFNFVGTYISPSAYRSNETIGASVTVPGDGAGNAGFNNPQSFSAPLTYTLSVVPEPGSIALIGLAGLGMLRRRK